MSIKAELDKITGAETPSRNIKQAIDRYTGTETPSKTIGEAVSKMGGEEPSPEPEPEPPEPTKYVAVEDETSGEDKTLNLVFSEGTPTLLYITVASELSKGERVQSTHQPVTEYTAITLADGSDAGLTADSLYVGNPTSYIKVEYIIV